MGFANTNGTDITTASGEPIYLQGVGIGNWLLPEGYMFSMLKEPGYDSPRGLEKLSREMIGPESSDAFWQKWKERYFTQDDARRLKEDGFNSIRFAYDWKIFFDEYTMAQKENGFKLLDQAIAWCKEYDLWVILDLHGAPGGQNGTNIDDGWGYPWLFLSERAQQRTCDIWQIFADRYKNEEIVLGYDLLNEPLPEKYKDSYRLLEPLYKKIAASIREVDKDHILILEGVNWASDLSALGTPFDDKAVYQFHKYWNDNNSEAIQRFLDFRDQYNVPIWCGETGENDYNWYASCSRLLKQHNIGWNVWPHKKRGENPSPYNINMPKEWDCILHYASSGERPSLDEAQKAYSKLLDAVLIDNCERDASAINSWLHPDNFLT